MIEVIIWPLSLPILWYTALGFLPTAKPKCSHGEGSGVQVVPTMEVRLSGIEEGKVDPGGETNTWIRGMWPQRNSSTSSILSQKPLPQPELHGFSPTKDSGQSAHELLWLFCFYTVSLLPAYHLLRFIFFSVFLFIIFSPALSSSAQHLSYSWRLFKPKEGHKLPLKTTKISFVNSFLQWIWRIQ